MNMTDIREEMVNDVMIKATEELSEQKALCPKITSRHYLMSHPAVCHLPSCIRFRIDRVLTYVCGYKCQGYSPTRCKVKDEEAEKYLTKTKIQ